MHVATHPIEVLKPQLPNADALLPYLREIDASRSYTNFGPLGSRFSMRLRDHFGLPFASVSLVNCGTSGLCGAILATVRHDATRPYALMPSLTFAATAIAAERCGLVPLICDVDPETWMLDPEALLEHPDLPRVAVVIPVAPFGRPVPQEPWRRFSRKTGIPVVIDAAAAFSTIERDPGLYLGEIPVVLSFHATKSFGVGEGGCVMTTDPEIAVAISCATNFGFFGERQSIAPSLNGKMSEFHAAVGLAAIEAWPARRAALGRLSRTYHDAFSTTSSVARLHTAPSIDGSYVLLECETALHARRAETVLTAQRIGTRFWYGRGLVSHRQFGALPHRKTDVSDDLCDRLLGLPSSFDLAEADIDRICGLVRRAIEADVAVAA